MINGASVRRMYVEQGPRTFLRTFFQNIGMENPVNGVRYFNPELNRNVIENQVWKPDHIHLRDLANAMLGTSSDDEMVRLLKTPAWRQIDVLEAGTDIGPSTFANVSAFNTAVAGLLEAKFLESYARPEFIADQLCQNIPSNKRSEKFIGISLPGDSAEERKPGNVHPRIQLSERYVTTPDTVNRANAVDVTREAVMFDTTRQLLTQCEKAAETLALRKEYLVIDTFLGVNNTYTYGGTNYNTYITSGNWINKVTGNTLVDWTQIDVANQLFTGMTDQETGQPIMVVPKDLFVMPAKFWTARGISRYTQNVRFTNSGAERGDGPNILSENGRNLNPIGYDTYPYAMKRATDASGLNLSASNAKVLWWLGDFKKTFGYISNMPPTVIRANPSDYEMADRGLVFSLFADEMGVPCVLEPRQTVYSTG